MKMDVSKSMKTYEIYRVAAATAYLLHKFKYVRFIANFSFYPLDL